MAKNKLEKSGYVQLDVDDLAWRSVHSNDMQHFWQDYCPEGTVFDFIRFCAVSAYEYDDCLVVQVYWKKVEE
jgi:hypothetical protein